MIRGFESILLLAVLLLFGTELLADGCVDGERVEQGRKLPIVGSCVEVPAPYPDRYDCGIGKHQLQGNETLCIEGTESGPPGHYLPKADCPIDEGLLQGSGTCAELPELKLSMLSELDDQVKETSGLAIVEGRLYTHNDSGGGNLLYEIDPATGEVLRTITVNGAQNVDWEDLAVDESYLYIADIGNNGGNRKDLKVYRVAKSELAYRESVDAETISFSYADQTKFDYESRTTPWDAEALIAYRGALYLFTKNWEDYTSKIYRLPAVPGNYELDPVGEAKLDVMVTGADADKATGSVALVGYTNPYDSSRPYRDMLVRLSAFIGDDLFSGRIAEYGVKYSVGIGALEAILLRTPTEFLLSAEGVTTQSLDYPAKLYETEIGGSR